MKSKSTKDASVASVVPKSGFLTFVIKQLREVLPPTLFFVIGFNLIVLTTQLILADYFIHFANFMLVTISALVLGKSVLVANALPFFRRFDTAPLFNRSFTRPLFTGQWSSWCGFWRSLENTG